MTYLEEKEIDFKKIISFSSDGASNMTGNYHGVISYIKKKNPWTISVHCTNHRLVLAYKDLIKEHDYLNTYISLIEQLYNYFGKSPSRNYLFKAYQLELEEEEIHILRHCKTRWLA